MWISKMLKAFLFISYASLTLGLATGQATGQGSVNFKSSIRQVALVLDSVWGSDTDEDMGAYTVNKATKDYDVVVKNDVSHWWTELMLVFYFKVPKNELKNYVNGKFDASRFNSSGKVDELYDYRLCWLISKDRNKEYAPDNFFPTEVLQMIFVGRDTCDFTKGATMVERSNVLTLNLDNSPGFELPDDKVWYLLVTIIHYSNIATPIESAFIRVGYQVTNL